MKIYLAGTSVSIPEKEERLQNLFKSSNKLHSYYHLHSLEKKWFEMNTKNKVNLFLDSGAFSAWTQGIKIHIQDYISFIKENKDVINVYANLDVIGIEGKQPNELTARKTLKNQKIMEKAGLMPIPVYHIGEPISYLTYYIENYEYLALGVAGNSGTKLIPWLDKLFSKYICDKNGIPKIKTHGFALTSLNLMMRFPWYSVDSTSWVVTGRMGSVYIPQYKNGKWIYNENSWKISISNKSPNMKDAGQHYTTMKPIEKTLILKYLNEKGYKVGKSEFKEEEQNYILKENEKWFEKKPGKKSEKRKVEIIIGKGISNTYQLRDELNIIYFLDLEKSLPKYPWAFQLQTMEGFDL